MKSEQTPGPQDIKTRASTERDRLMTTLMRRGRDEDLSAQDDIATYVSQMKAKYPNYLKVRAYYGLAQGTIPSDMQDSVDLDDFPDRDSVFVFLQNLRDKYLKQSE